MTQDRLHQLDKLYQSVVAALDKLVVAVGLKMAASLGSNENKILLGAPITDYAFSQTPLRKSRPFGAQKPEVRGQKPE
jgi:hypothetical protein